MAVTPGRGKLVTRKHVVRASRNPIRDADCTFERRKIGTSRGTDVPPRFFVSVASKGFSQDVSPLFATLAGRSISVASKGLKARVAVTQLAAVSRGL